MLNIISHQGSADQNYNEMSLTNHYVTKIQKWIIISVDKGVKILEPSCY